MYAKPGTWTGAVLENALPLPTSGTASSPQVHGPLRCQSFGLAESSCTQRAGAGLPEPGELT